MKFLNLLKWSLIISFVYLIFLAYPYFFSKINRFSSLGFLSLVDQSYEPVTHIFLPDRNFFSNHLLKGEKLIGKFKASENNLGILLIRFAKLSAIVTDRLTFRIKGEGDKDWYYQNSYTGDQFQPDQYFTFGFHTISHSKNKIYVFEIESLNGSYKHGIGLSNIKPQIASVYKFSVYDLKNYKIFLPFIDKKIVYAINNIDYVKVIEVFLLTLTLLFYIKNLKSKKILFLILNFVKNLRKGVRYNKKIMLDYLLELKVSAKNKKNEILIFLYSNKIYKFLKTYKRKRFTIALIILLIAFLYRVSISLSYPNDLFYSGIGGQGDYDMLIKVARCAFVNYFGCANSIQYDFMFLTPLLGFLYIPFGFTGGIKVFLYLMILISSIIATIPYLILSRDKWFTLGGIIGSLFLTFNQLLTRMSYGFPIDNSSLFTFSIFTLFYFIVTKRDNLFLLISLGLGALVDGLNKVLFLVNDLGALILFIPIFIFGKFSVSGINLGKFRYRHVFLSILPLLTFLILYIGWEIFVHFKYFGSHYFLKQIFFENGGGYGIYTTNNSHLNTNLFSQGVYYLTSGIIVVKRMLDYMEVGLSFYAITFFALLYFFIKRRKKLVEGILLALMTLLTISVLLLIADNFQKIQIAFPVDAINLWNGAVYLKIFLLLEIIILFILTYGYFILKYFAPIITYVSMLIIISRSSSFPRLYTQVVAWNLILIAYIIHILFVQSKKDIIEKFLVFGIIVIFLFSSALKFSNLAQRLYFNTINLRDEITYLSWVNNSLPQNSIILGGGDDNLVTISDYIKKPIIYNSFVPFSLLIPTNRNYREVKNLDLNSYLLDNKNFKKNRYFFLDMNKELWEIRLTREVDAIFSKLSGHPNPENYIAKIYKTNKNLDKSIYELRMK